MSVAVKERERVSAPVLPAGSIPESEFGWLEALRLEHPGLIEARQKAIAAVAAVKAEHATLRSTYEAELAAAARAGGEPPVLPARLSPEYARTRLVAAQEADVAAVAALVEHTGRVAAAVGQHRTGEEWQAAVADPDADGAEALRRFEARWTWPPPRPIRATLEELEAEIAAADAVVLEIRRPMEARMTEWHRACAEHETGKPMPAMPEFSNEDHLLGSAMERAGRAHAALDEARRMGRVA
ncbi:hypothetical protein NBH00_14865 [Paraconexibacter antarcticus]|uniref:Uncharacterized protein n=1 Tax=Paraconexibacter antarcticus TaxID=2949664 RepID=A0ABY5DP05_9ACTN|nr:hypothetical protein [Paraconexibacter antarcticus]UTI62639.1 hypothetical protein NBH00_14865 [Paraconexibacter antarcticus]